MPKRILIVDDENYIRLLLRRTLEELEFSGVEIHLAEDGVTGLAAARALKPDLVFLDLMMPRLTGEEVCAAIRRTPDLANTYIVILTAKGQLPTFSDAEAPNECMTKPFDPDEIVDRAAEVLGIELDFQF